MKRSITLSFLVLFAVFYFGEKAWGQNDGSDGPDRPQVDRPDVLPPDLRDKIEDYRTERHALRSELRERLAELDHPTDEEIHDEIGTVREENSDRIDGQRDLARMIHDELRDIRRDRPHRPRPRPHDRVVRDRITDFHTERDALKQERHNFLDSIKDLPADERETAIHDFREEHRQRVEEQKERRRQIHRDIRDHIDGERRSDEGDSSSG